MITCEEPSGDPVPAGGMAGRCTNGRSVALRRDALARASVPIAAAGRSAPPACRSKPNVFYIGVNNGGVWKTTDYGLTWTPLFDGQPTAVDRRDRGRAVESEHRLRRQRRRAAAAGSLGRRRRLQDRPTPARPGSISGLREARQIGAIIVDPQDPDRLFVAGAGPPVRAERGARRLSLHRRRRIVSAGAVQGREHRRDRPRVRSGERRRRSMPCCGRRGRGRGRYDNAGSGADQRTVQVAPTAARPGSR